MKTAIRSIVLTSILATGTAGAAGINVGGSPMLAQKDIIENAMNSKDHTTLVAAVKAAGLVDTLQGKGPFTVFAPTNAAFSGLPAGTVDTLLKPENKSQLTGILTYHVVPGKYTKHDLEKLIKKDGGKAMLKTASGGMLTFMMNGPENIQIKDASGAVANISTYDVMQKNGVIDVIDKVLMPK
ncbi:fasciclin domain-containing protein [Eoetvoesiella caeni]|uniref:Putative surface protein with fasciclin (FAS1) repeats n=1 Tax=Eoetvoesiella caeni TaxID=645616 RepID=A0A366H9W6_9BURK|nr:fasciclin domain-containing protein [Eoetvoesiella caeni]MCI2809896.1 fasciclin domain-containing protein [Eoetvoesiella caeni]NYT56187.1 fasciclin domain-containing protein [Eoetvoesiella caeni]RBP38244.1 putative surface protein with fasciclin (FAS1) repeats [Eoetvoesiella caeni]